MKCLLLDAETTRVVSTVFSQSEILEHEVYLVERLEAERGDQLLHLKVRVRRVRPAGILCSIQLAGDTLCRRACSCGCACACACSGQLPCCHAAALTPAMLARAAAALQAVCFLRPTRENIARIRRELRDPRFGEYHLCERAALEPIRFLGYSSLPQPVPACSCRLHRRPCWWRFVRVGLPPPLTA